MPLVYYTRDYYTEGAYYSRLLQVDATAVISRDLE